jgi:hypothetical protein
MWIIINLPRDIKKEFYETLITCLEKIHSAKVLKKEEFIIDGKAYLLSTNFASFICSDKTEEFTELLNSKVITFKLPPFSQMCRAFMF